nr:hypothetical protein [Tanacetum cinerariifolium]
IFGFGWEDGNQKKKDGDKVGTESSTRPIEIMVSSFDGSKENGKSPTDVAISSNGKANKGQQPVPNENVNNRQIYFASLVTNKTDTKVNFRSLDTDKPINAKVEVKIPKASVLEVHSRFGFSLYSYFVVKRLAFPVVEYYVKNAWQQYNIVRVMMNSKGFFFFKFASIEGMNGVLENGPWFIRFVPIHLKKWTPTTNLLNEDLDLVLICVKLHDILIVSFTVDVLSAMATRLVDKPKKQHTTYDGFHYLLDILLVVLTWGLSPSTTPLVARINELESQMLDGKFVLVGDDGKPLKPCESTFPSSSNMASKKVDDLVNEDSDDEVLEVYNETSTFMDSTNVHEASKSGNDLTDPAPATTLSARFFNRLTCNNTYSFYQPELESGHELVSNEILSSCGSGNGSGESLEVEEVVAGADLNRSRGGSRPSSKVVTSNVNITIFV